MVAGTITKMLSLRQLHRMKGRDRMTMQLETEERLWTIRNVGVCQGGT